MANSSQPVHVNRLNLDQLGLSPQPSDYQKIPSTEWPQPDQMDSCYTCIFCDIPNSPRRTNLIIKKQLPDSPPPETTEVYYSCLSQVRSTTNSPRDPVFMPSSPSFTPRQKAELRATRRLSSRSYSPQNSRRSLVTRSNVQ